MQLFWEVKVEVTTTKVPFFQWVMILAAGEKGESKAETMMFVSRTTRMITALGDFYYS